MHPSRGVRWWPRLACSEISNANRPVDFFWWLPSSNESKKFWLFFIELFDEGCFFFEGLYVCVHEKLYAILSVMIGLFCSQIAKFANLARLTQTACLMLVSTLIRFADLSPREIEGLGFMPDTGGTWSVAIFFFLAAHIVATMAATWLTGCWHRIQKCLTWQ